MLYVAGMRTWVGVWKEMWGYECGWANRGAAEGLMRAAYTTIVYIVCVIHTHVV